MKRCACAVRILILWTLVVVPTTTVHASAFLQIRAILNHLAYNDNAKLVTLSVSGQKRPILGAVITDPELPVQGKTRIVIVAGQHGNEPNPALSVAQLALRWSSDPSLGDLRRRAIVMIIPAANPDGLAHGSRFDGSGADPNRDWSRRTLPETRAIAGAIDQWRPHLVIDEHEWSQTDGQRFNCVELSRTCPNPELVTLARRIRSAPVCSGFAAVDSQPGRSESLLHRHCTAEGYLAYLVETAPGISAAKKTQLYSHVTIALARRAIASRDAIDACSASAKPYELPAQLIAWHESRPAKQMAQTGVQAAVALVGLYCLMLLCGRRAKLPEAERQVAVRVRYRSLADGAPVTPHGLVPELTYRSATSRRVRRGR